MDHLLLRLGEQLYRVAPTMYRIAYSAYKAWSDRLERRLLTRLLSPGKTVVDVGANIGIYSEFFARRVGSDGAVFAFEPHPTNFGRLSRVPRHYPQVHCRQAAVAEASGSLRLFISESLNVDHHTYDCADGRASIVVEAVALDDFFTPGYPVHLIKIDVQGAELAVLKGAKRILQANRQIEVLFEYWPYGLKRAGASGAELLRFLSDLGFQCRGIASRQIGDLLLMPEHPLVYTNVHAQRMNQ